MNILPLVAAKCRQSLLRVECVQNACYEATALNGDVSSSSGPVKMASSSRALQLQYLLCAVITASGDSSLRRVCAGNPWLLDDPNTEFIRVGRVQSSSCHSQEISGRRTLYLTLGPNDTCFVRDSFRLTFPLCEWWSSLLLRTLDESPTSLCCKNAASCVCHVSKAF
ncbi:hypothetical protein MVEN_00481000 [Mycena venus]|uniref:Uncharacterized protein n=1 Tax=Mycena venus TaxID=2733690 RepID=A0A8H6YRT8_9AGAR|nr:hypothetical protein MVEN_00481000 [Mycena venus]